MAITGETTAQTRSAVLIVRVPRDTDTTLATEASTRLSRIDGVQTVTVDALEGIEPGLSATAVTVRVTITATENVPTLRETLTETTAVEAIEQLDERRTA